MCLTHIYFRLAARVPSRVGRSHPEGRLPDSRGRPGRGGGGAGGGGHGAQAVRDQGHHQGQAVQVCEVKLGGRETSTGLAVNRIFWF